MKTACQICILYQLHDLTARGGILLHVCCIFPQLLSFPEPHVKLPAKIYIDGPPGPQTRANKPQQQKGPWDSQSVSLPRPICTHIWQLRKLSPREIKWHICETGQTEPKSRLSSSTLKCFPTAYFFTFPFQIVFLSQLVSRTQYLLVMLPLFPFSLLFSQVDRR